MAYEKVKFIQEYGGPVKISAGCVEECCVKESEEASAEDAGCVDAEAIWSHG